MHSSALLRLVVGGSALVAGVQAQSSELPIPSSAEPSSIAPSEPASSVAPSEPASSVAPSEPASSVAPSEPISSEPPSSTVDASAIVTDTTTVTDTVYPETTSFHHEPTSFHYEPTLTHYTTIDKCQKYHGKDCYPGQVHTKHYKPKEWYYEWYTTYISYVHGVATTCTDTYTRTTWYDQEKTTVKHYQEKQTYYETHGGATVTLTKEKPTQTLVPIYPTVTVPAPPKPPVTVPAPPKPPVTIPAPPKPPVTVIPHPEPEHTVTAEKPVQPPATVVPVPVPEPETSHVIVSGQPSLRDAGFLPLLIALGALPVGMAILM
ncbi:hypothetical protein ACHAQH_006092 [Verticillium albo-atrum]